MAANRVVLEALSGAPIPELRSGGLGVRDVKRLVKVTGIDDQRLGRAELPAKHGFHRSAFKRETGQLERAESPPSMVRMQPLVYADFSEARKSVAAAISSGVPGRPKDMLVNSSL